MLMESDRIELVIVQINLFWYMGNMEIIECPLAM